MFVSVHAISGVAVASVIANPLISLPVAFGLHFVLDAIPHAHADPRNDSIKKQNTLAAIDFALACAVAIGFSSLLNNWSLAWGAFAASIMDLDAVLFHRVYKQNAESGRRLFPRKLSAFHGRIQNETLGVGGYVSQLVIIVLSLLTIYA